MKETQLLGTLLPSHPDLIPIGEAIREEYKLPEISPDDDPITEIFKGDIKVPLIDFLQNIENRILENPDFLPPGTAKLFKSSKAILEMQEIKDVDLLPIEMKQSMESFLTLAKGLSLPMVQLIEAYLKSIAYIVYLYSADRRNRRNTG